MLLLQFSLESYSLIALMQRVVMQTKIAIRILLVFAFIGSYIVNEVECKPIPSRSSRQLLVSDALTWRTGTLVIRTMSYANGDDAEAYLLRTSGKGRLIELQVDEELVSFLYPGQNVTVHGSFIDDDKFEVVEMFPTELDSTSASYASDNGSPPQSRRKAAEEDALKKGDLDPSQASDDYSE
jgi:hypothetical protein